MSQFSIHANSNADTKSDFPYLLDIQSSLLSDLDSRTVIPLALSSNPKYMPISKLTPIVEVKGRKYTVLTPLLAGIPKKILGPEIADLSSLGGDIISAIDLLITGF